MISKFQRAVPLALLLGLFWWMAASTSPRMGATGDERLHLVGGYTYWKFNDYRLQPENGNLTMRVEALLLLPMPLAFPPIETRGLRHLDRGTDTAHEFLYAMGNPFDAMLARARLMTGVFSLVTLGLVWCWARKLFGPAAGWLALIVAIFCPTLLAHSALATSDAAATMGFLAAMTACWLLLHRVTWLRLLAGGAAVAAALLAKYSSVMLAPMAGLLLIARWTRPVPLVIALGHHARWIRPRGQTIAATLAVSATTGLLACVLIWAAYGFRYSAANPHLVTADASADLNWAYQSGRLAGQRLTPAVIGWARDHHVLPEAWLYGFTDSFTGSRARPAFLMGKVSTTGWREFFPIAFLIKSPPTLLLLVATGVIALLVATLRRRAPAGRWPRRGWLYRAAPLWLLFTFYWLVAINTPLNIGHRHLLPVYPMLYVLAGATAGWWLLTRRRAVVALVVGGTVAVHAVDSWGSRPFYLSYFTPWIGGSEQGWRYLTDSSSDWGQGLPDLARWLAAKEARGDRAPVFLTYFGTDSPEARHLPVTRFGDLIRDLSPRSYPAAVRGGWFVIGATHYQRYYLRLDGPWTSFRETAYQELLQRLRKAPADVGSLPAAERQPWADAARTFETLQFGRLCAFLGDRKPDAFIGGSLLVFRLTDAEVQRALYGPVVNGR